MDQDILRWQICYLSSKAGKTNIMWLICCHLPKALLESHMACQVEIAVIQQPTGGFNFQNAWTTGWIAAQYVFAP